MDCQYLTACTTHLGVSDVVKPGSALLFLKGACFSTALPFCLFFSGGFIHGFTCRAALHFDKR